MNISKSFLTLFTASLITVSIYSDFRLPDWPSGIENTTGSSRKTSQLLVKLTDDTATTLKSVSPFPIGIAFNSSVIENNKKAKNLFLAQFNAKTVHAYLNTEPTQGKFMLKEVDYWVGIARTQRLRLHGHCLVYHIACPAWINQFASRDSFEIAIHNHIQTIVGRYKGKIESWDVINELFESKTGAIRETPFRKLYNSDADYLEFVKRCFRWAHDADPNAKLFYNDYNLESSESKLNAVIALVQNLQQTGVPIHGVGTQMHININTLDYGIENAFKRLSSLEIPIHVSELDISVNPGNNPTMSFSSIIENTQAMKYETVAKLYKRTVPTNLQYGITLWSFGDADSWLVTVKKQHDIPTIFDTNFNKKPAYFGLLTGLQE